MFDIKNQNTFLGGQNVHNLIIIGLLIYIIFKLMKKSEESGLTQSLAGSKLSLRGGGLSTPKPNDLILACANPNCQLMDKNIILPDGRPGIETACRCAGNRWEDPIITK